MRGTILVVAALVALSFVSVLPDAEARWAYCTELRGNCDGIVCYDSNLNGRYDPQDDCFRRHCPMGGCCGGPCPPPPQEA